MAKSNTLMISVSRHPRHRRHRPHPRARGAVRRRRSARGPRTGPAARGAGPRFARTSGPMFARAAIAGLMSVGVRRDRPRHRADTDDAAGGGAPSRRRRAHADAPATTRSNGTRSSSSAPTGSSSTPRPARRVRALAEAGPPRGGLGRVGALTGGPRGGGAAPRPGARPALDRRASRSGRGVSAWRSIACAAPAGSPSRSCSSGSGAG